MNTPLFVSSFTPSLWNPKSTTRLCSHRRTLSVHACRRSELKREVRSNSHVQQVSAKQEATTHVKGDEEVVPSGKVYAPRQMRGGGRRLVGNVRTQGRKYVRLPPNPPGIRVAAGSMRGRMLKTPNVYLRPMMGKVREALFSMLQVFGAIRENGSVLDLYAGCGSVGIEALSRGMGHATFVDYAPECIETTSRNLESCQFQGRSETACMSVEDFLSSWKEKKRLEAERERGTVDKNVVKRDYFDLITITPPYQEVDYAVLMQQVVDSGCVGDGTFVVVEYPVEINNMPPTIAHRLIGIRNRKYGRTVLAVYACQPPVDLQPRPDEFSTGKR